MKKGLIVVLLVVAIATLVAQPAYAGGHGHWNWNNSDAEISRHEWQAAQSRQNYPYYPNGHYYPNGYGYGAYCEGPVEIKIFGIPIISIGPKPQVVIVPPTPPTSSPPPCPRNP